MRPLITKSMNSFPELHFPPLIPQKVHPQNRPKGQKFGVFGVLPTHVPWTGNTLEKTLVCSVDPRRADFLSHFLFFLVEKG